MQYSYHNTPGIFLVFIPTAKLACICKVEVQPDEPFWQAFFKYLLYLLLVSLDSDTANLLPRVALYLKTAVNLLCHA